MLLSRVVNSQSNKFKKKKCFGLVKYPFLLMLAYIGNKSKLFEKNVKQLKKNRHVSPSTPK